MLEALSFEISGDRCFIHPLERFFLPLDQAWQSLKFSSVQMANSTCCIWHWPLHHRLPRASSSHVHCPELVPKVWSISFFNIYTWWVWKIKVYSWLATTWWRSATSPKDLEFNWKVCEAIPTSSSLDRIQNSRKCLGSYLHFMYNTMPSDFQTSVAIYRTLPSCRHIRGYHPWPTSPAD